MPVTPIFFCTYRKFFMNLFKLKRTRNIPLIYLKFQLQMFIYISLIRFDSSIFSLFISNSYPLQLQLNRYIKNYNYVSLTSFLFLVIILVKKWVLRPYSYCSSGLLVSFFILSISYKYNLPSASCLTSILTE